MEKILLDINDLQMMLSCGRNAALMIGQEADAIVMLGSKKLYRREAIENYVRTHDVLLDRVRSN